MEKLYHYLWKSAVFGKVLRDADGKSVEVIDPGIHNLHSGPDFFNSKIRVGGVEWAGNVEIHVKASDWFRHNHHTDPAYDGVILHAVGVSDTRIARKDGSMIPQVELLFPESFFKTYALLIDEIDAVRCAPCIGSFSALEKTDWIETLAIERLQEKAGRIKELLEFTRGNWEQTCFIILSRALGFGLNGEPFEMLARSVDLKILHHHSDNLFQLEAILFGQAALLDSSIHIFDEYYQGLCREYYFLARKYGLSPMRQGLWKYARTRPGNFPHRRIAYLASLAEGGFSLFSKIIEGGTNSDDLKNLFNRPLSGYWKNHQDFGTDPRETPALLSASSVAILIINVIAPVIYAYAASKGELEMAEKAMNLWMDLPAENNAITRQWTALGIKPEDAAMSQALIHLKKNYCDMKKCLYCRFGTNMLRKAVRSEA